MKKLDEAVVELDNSFKKADVKLNQVIYFEYSYCTNKYQQDSKLKQKELHDDYLQQKADQNIYLED